MPSDRSAADPPLHVAVLEDDDEFREEILVRGLARPGFRVEGFATSDALDRRMRATTFDLLVLDIGLAGEHGLDVARRLRGLSPIGIVALTGRADRAEQIAGLGESVDAWLLKPVDIDVLAATLHSVGRRLGADTGSSGRWRIDDNGWHLRAPDGSSLVLTLVERQLLRRLFAAAGEPVARAELIAALAPAGDEFDPHRLEMLVHRLRRRIGEQLGTALPLRALRGRGYVLVAGDERDRDD